LLPPIITYVLAFCANSLKPYSYSDALNIAGKTGGAASHTGPIKPDIGPRFRGIRQIRLSTTSHISRQLRGIRNWNYESAWTWDIFLLSMLDEMVSASY
jgi:hypothetical protein